MSDPAPSLARDFVKGHVLFREGDMGGEMYVVQKGSVVIEKRLGGSEQSVAEIGPGDFFGEMAVLNDRPRTATAVCKSDTTCIVIGKKTLEGMIVGSPEIALRLIRRLARRLDNADTMVEILLQPDPRARVLLAIKTKIDAPTPTKAAAIASEVGASVDQVKEVVSRLRRLKLAQIEDDGSIKVTDQARFFEFLEFVESPRKAESG
jgi:CRP-like cAMP-binding protein